MMDDTREALARAPRAWQTTMNYDSWTDNDLYRAIEVDPDCAFEYIAELNARRAARAAQAELVERVNSLYGMVPTYKEYIQALPWRDKIRYNIGRVRLFFGF